MYRRPWPIVIFAFLQIFVEPTVNVFLSAWMSGATVRYYLHALFAEGDYLGAFYIMALPIIMGLSVYAMKRWSYSIFVACSTWMLVRNFNVIEQSQINVAGALAFYLGNIAFVSYFLMPAVREPYLDKRLRWWETDKRYLVNVSGRVELAEATESVACQISDLSVGGVFLTHTSRLPQDEIVRLRFSPNGRHIISVRARIVFLRAQGERWGHGLQFIELTSATRQMLKSLIRDLKQSGCPSRNPAESDWTDFRKWAGKLLATGHGILPEYVRPVPRPAVIAAPAEENERRDQVA